MCFLIFQFYEKLENIKKKVAFKILQYKNKGVCSSGFLYSFLLLFLR